MDPAHPGTRFRTRHVVETGSTNADVSAAASAGEPEGLVLVADHQTAGRGRLGRSWVAPPGSALLTSVLLRPPPMATHLAVAAVACAAAAACGVAGIKWPNDLVADDDRKLAGILAEASGGNMTAITVGLGLNISAPPDFPEELRATATSLDQLMADVPSRDQILGAILDELEPRYATLCDAGPAELIAEYRRRCVTIGRTVRIEQHHETWEGVATGLDAGGALLVDRPSSGVVAVSAGDVVHVRPA